MRSTIGKNIQTTIYGASHAEQIGVIIEGLPENSVIDLKRLRDFMARRAPGNSPLATARKEPDRVLILRGAQGSDELVSTDGSPLEAVIKNTDVRSGDYKNLSAVPRPGHADYTAYVKYGGKLDMAGGGPFSARMTAPLCIAGGIAIQLLEKHGITICGEIFSIGDIKDSTPDPCSVTAKELESLKKKAFPVIDDQKGDKMKALITTASQKGDSVGGVVQVYACGCPAGIGGPMYDGLESVLAPIFFGIPAVKGVEFGAGFAASELKGSQNNDSFYYEGNKVKTKTNNHGGILGGITSGMPLIARIALKPTPSIAIEQDSVDLTEKKSTKLVVRGRHDPCVVTRAVPVAEAAMAIGLLDSMMEGNNEFR